MKAVLYADSFKNMVSRIAPAVAKKTLFNALRYVKIEVKDGLITATGTDIDNTLTINLFGRAIEDGTCFIDLATLKKMVVKGDEVKISADDINITVGTGKKNYEILNMDYSKDFPETPVMNVNKMESTHIDSAVLSSMKTLATMASGSEYQTLMHAVRFDMENSRLICLDGCRIGIWNITGVDAMQSFTADLKCVEILKSAIGKGSEDIKASCDGKYARFAGENFVYTTRCVEGEYYNCEGLLKAAKEDFGYEFKVNSKNLEEVAKEYKKGVDKDNKKPMLFTGHVGGYVITAFDFGTYMTSDVLEDVKWMKWTVASGENDFFKGANPEYIVDACAFIGDDCSIRSKVDKRSAIYMYGDDKEVIVLPVNFSSEDNRLLTFARKAS